MMKDGDIYFWRWKDNRRHADGKPYGAYHCKSQKAVFKNGALRDTYWCGISDSRLNLDDIVVEFQGNSNEMRETNAWEADYYRLQDIVDMRHSNASQAKIYVKAGAERDPDTMRAHIKYKIEQCGSEICSAERQLARLKEAVTAIDNGRLDEVYE